jgi:hypothetical protein
MRGMIKVQLWPVSYFFIYFLKKFEVIKSLCDPIFYLVFFLKKMVFLYIKMVINMKKKSNKKMTT